MLGGVDLRRLADPDLRRAVVMVTQESFLFTGSVADNIAFGRPDAGRAEWRPRPGPSAPTTFAGASRGLRHRGRQAGRPAVGRPAPAGGLRPGLPGRPPGPHPGRGHLVARPPQRATGPAGPPHPAGRPHRRRSSPTACRRVEIADRVLVVDRGRIVEDGAPADLSAVAATTAACAGPGWIRWCNLLPPLRVRNYPDGTSGHQRDQKRPALSRADPRPRSAGPPSGPGCSTSDWRRSALSEYAATTIEGLCSGAAVTPRHFYEEFPSRESLLTAVFDEVVTTTTDALAVALAGAGPLDLRGRHPRRGGPPSSTPCATIPAGPVSCAWKRLGSAPTSRPTGGQVTHAFTALTEAEAGRVASRTGTPARNFHYGSLALVGATKELVIE